MGPMEGVYFVIQPYFCIFLCDQLLHVGYDLDGDKFSMPIHIFTSMGAYLVVDREYRSCDVLLVGKDTWKELITLGVTYVVFSWDK